MHQHNMELLNDNCNDPAPVPAPRTKKKKKLASALSVTHFNSVSDETLPKVIPPRRKNRCKTSVELEIIIKDCCCKDNKSDIIGIVATDDSTSVTINDEAVDIIEIPHTVGESKLTNTHDITKGNNMYIQLEEQGQDDSGVYLPEAMSSGNNLADFMQIGHHIDNVITPDAVSSSIKNITLSNSVIPLLGDLEEINIDNYPETVNTELLNSEHLLQEEFSDSSNIPLVTTSSTTVNSSNVLIDNVEEAINDTVSRIYQILDYKEPQKTFYKEDENSFLGYPVYGSDDKGDVFHERDKDISVTASSNCNNVVQFLFPREPPPVHRTLQCIESSISLLMNPYHFDHMIEGNVVPPDLWLNSLSLLLSDNEPSNTLIRSIQLRMSETDSSVNSVYTASNNSSEQCTTLLKEELEEVPVPTTGEDCCLYSALGNVEAFTNSNGRNQQLAAIENVNKLQVDCEEEEEDKKYSYKTYRRSEIHPKKISESFDLFLQHMLMDSEQYDLNYQSDNTESSINFECALNQTFHDVAGTQVTILTDKTNKGPNCLELNEEDIIHLPVDSMASPRCIIVESDIKAGVACDNINNKCGKCSQYVRDSENANIHNENSCAVSVVSINTAVPSSNESCQSSFHTDHQDFSDLNRSNNITSPIGTSEDISKSFVNSVDHSSEDYNLINSGDFIEIVNEDSFLTTNKRDKLPSESMDTINKLSDIFQQQNVINPQVPVVVKVKGKPLTKNGINDDCLDVFRIEMENNSESNKCDSENNNNVENISSENKIWFAPSEEAEMENDYMKEDPSKEYNIILEKMWGTLGIQIEECSGFEWSSPWIRISNLLPGGPAHLCGCIQKGDRLLEINGHPLSSYEEATDLLKRSADVVHLKFLHRRHSSSNRKGRHDPATGSPASSRRSKRRHHCHRQNLSSLNPDSGMGSNVSRHSEKGLSGRRTQSSGNLCNGNKILAPNVGRILVPCSGGVGPKDRNKFCGSLPNHLDSKHSGGDGDLPGPCCNGNNNNGEHVVKNKRNEVELRLHPLPPSCALDPSALHDQGYGSERSPEDEQPPSLPGMLELSSKYPFITREATFEVCLLKGSRGLGLSVTGGVDSGEQWPGLIRIKRLFPHQPAWQSGQLSQGDILLAANGVPLVGLTNYQALEVLRKTPNNVVLTVCRPPSDVFCIQAPSEPPPPPRRDPAHSISSSSHHILPLPPLQTSEGPCGEFDIMLTKVNRSLGFTLRKEDESVLGHYVRALVREPALSDGRIKPGDKIVAVNDVDISPMSHEEAVMFLRQCGDQVKLRLYRDAAQTPVSALSPSEEVKIFKPKLLLRKEAMDMLSDLAVKKLSPCDSSGSSYSKLRRVSDGQSSSPCSSPRRRRLTKTPSPDIQAATLDRLGQKYMVTSHVGNSDSSGEQSRTSTFTYPSMDSTKARGNASSYASTIGSGDSIDMKPQRPNFLDLCGGNATPGTSRKQKFTFSVAATGDDEWESLAPTSESDELATNTTLGSVSQYYPTTSNSSEEFRTECVDNGDLNYDGSLPTEPASMPPLTNLSSTSSTSTAFSYRNPAYQSAHPACYAANNQNSMRKNSDDTAERASDQDIPGKLFNCQAGSGGEGSRGLLKWKGVVFTPENDEVEELGSCNVPTYTDDTSSQVTVDRENEQGDQVFMVELTRGWNSRLGFSLRGDGRHTYISAIYADSVAAKDGRLQAGDQVLMVNDENVEEMSTAEVIDLLRKIRGTIGITVLRKSGPNLPVS